MTPQCDRPTQGPPALIHFVTGDSSRARSTSSGAVAGYPALTVPMGYAFGLPVGITFMGTAWTEPMLVKFAYAFEQATRVRRAPPLHVDRRAGPDVARFDHS